LFIFASDKMHRVKEMADQVANTDVAILIQGETGAGKEVVARYIHLNSFRKDKPFVKVNCAALPQELIESELFGYEKGAFTGAYRQRPGKFELADGGTIFLDEIAEMGPSPQAKLLHVLQDGTFSPLGGKNDIRVNVRVIAASNQNIGGAVDNGHFRKDLYYRLSVVTIAIPPLRERIEEIPIFAEYLLDKFGKKYNKEVKPLSERMKTVLLEHHWPGNIRELENVLHRLVVLGNEMVIDDLVSENRIYLLPEKKELNLSDESWPSLKNIKREALLKTEAEVIRKALGLTHWNRGKAASLLGISYKALLYKIKTYRLKDSKTGSEEPDHSAT
jgi:two-component system response regulator AtoC